VGVTSRALNNLAIIYGDRGNEVAAIESFHRAAELARQTADLNAELFYSANEIKSQLELGRILEVDRRYIELRNLMEDLPDPGSAGRTLNWLEAEIEFFKGDFHLALQLIERNIRNERATNDLSSLLGSLGTMSHLLVLAGELNQAKKFAEEAIEIASSFDRGVRAYEWASVIDSKRLDVQQASESLEHAHKIMRNDQVVFWRQVSVNRAEAHLLAAQNKWHAAWEKFAENQELLSGKQIRWHAAWFEVEWADSYLMRGRPEDIERGRELLANAHSEFKEMGAPGWVELIDGKLEKIEQLSQTTHPESS
jgi:tetratricopeptide (TPR) repeat protein